MEHTTWSSGIHPEDVRMVQHMQFNNWDLSLSQNER